jgi:hypothetical protein
MRRSPLYRRDCSDASRQIPAVLYQLQDIRMASKRITEDEDTEQELILTYIFQMTNFRSMKVAEKRRDRDRQHSVVWQQTISTICTSKPQVYRGLSGIRTK